MSAPRSAGDPATGADVARATRDDSPLEPQAVYTRRFEGESEFRRAMWRTLCRDFFQRHIPEGSSVLEVAAGHCEFINHVAAGRRIAADINPDTARHAAPGVEVVIAPSDAMTGIIDGSVDVIFISNFFEHLSRVAIASTVRECHRILRPGGRLLILQPNYRYCARDYWMFFDHVTPVDDRALVELLELTGFRMRLVIPRFLPFTTKSRIPRSLLLIRVYLRLPFLWRLWGAQAFLVADR